MCLLNLTCTCHLSPFTCHLYEDWRRVKKHIKEAYSNTIFEQENEGNIFDILENM